MSKKITKITVENDQNDIIVRDLKIDQIIPNTIDNFSVSIIDGHHTLIIPSNITGDIFAMWKKNRGGIFSKDVLRHALNKRHGKYIHINTDKLNCIARVISDDELDYFQSKKLVDGIIKDIHYMILKNIKNGQKLTEISKNINESEITQTEIETISMNVQTDIIDDDAGYHTGSISLIE